MAKSLSRLGTTSQRWTAASINFLAQDEIRRLFDAIDSKSDYAIFLLAYHPARGSAPWFPKNLYTRVRVLLGLPPGGDPFDQRAWPGQALVPYMGNRSRERGHARYLVHPWSLRTRDPAAVRSPPRVVTHFRRPCKNRDLASH